VGQSVVSSMTLTGAGQFGQQILNQTIAFKTNWHGRFKFESNLKASPSPSLNVTLTGWWQNTTYPHCFMVWPHLSYRCWI